MMRQPSLSALSAVPCVSEQRHVAARASGGVSADPIYEAVLRLLRAEALSGTVLDFGAGAGNLARFLCEDDRFSSVVGADLYGFPGRLEHPRLRWIFCDLNEPMPAEEGTFDVITAVEVIEHLENPWFLAREWFRLLRPGGTLVLSTPNNESWRSLLTLLFKGHFAAFVGPCYPAHITALLRADLQRIVIEAGFEAVRFAFTDVGAVPRLTRWTWQQLSSGLLRTLRYSDNLLCAARKPLGSVSDPSARRP